MDKKGMTTDARILVVEDESIVAMNIQDKLKELGYSVIGMVSYGEEALSKVEETKPDLVLMDIVLKGDMDGIEAAEKIREKSDVPVVYLTAYSDDNTLKRAKITEPHGYILKPFEQRELHINIEIALYKYRMEKKLKQSEQWLLATLRMMGCGVIAADVDENITFMNAGAEKLTGWKFKDALENKAEAVFNVSPEKPFTKAVKEGLLIGNDSILTDKNGKETSIDYSAVAIRDDNDNDMGVVVVIHNIGEGV